MEAELFAALDCVEFRSGNLPWSASLKMRREMGHTFFFLVRALWGAETCAAAVVIKDSSVTSRFALLDVRRVMREKNAGDVPLKDRCHVSLSGPRSSPFRILSQADRWQNTCKVLFGSQSEKR